MGKFAEISLLIEQGNEEDLAAFLGGKGIINPCETARKMIEEYDKDIQDAMHYEYSKQYESHIIEGRVDDGSWEGR